MKRSLPLIASLLLMMSVPRLASAQTIPPADPNPVAGGATAKAAAVALFEEGRRLMGLGKVDEACPKFAASYKLNPAGGTVLNLALCHEAQGRTATAWAEFNEGLALALRTNSANREKIAREHIAKLQPDLNKIAVFRGANANVAGMVLRIDNVALGEEVWGTPTPVDPGPHEIIASAPGYHDGKWTVTIDKAIPRLDFEVPALVEKPPEPTPVVILPEPAMSPGRRVAMYSAFTVAGLGVAGGSLFALLAIVKKGDADKECVSATPGSCMGPNKADAVHVNNLAITYSWVSTAAFGAGAVSAALGAYLLFVKPRSTTTTRTTGLLVVPQLGPQGSGVSVMQSW